MRSGFSLVELVMVLAIIAVLAAIAVPRFGQSTARMRLETSAARLVADLEQARALAAATSRPVQLSFAPGSSVYSMYTAGQRVSRVNLAAAPFGAAVESVTGVELNTVAFDGRGRTAESTILGLRSGSFTIGIVVRGPSLSISRGPVQYDPPIIVPGDAIVNASGNPPVELESDEETP